MIPNVGTGLAVLVVDEDNEYYEGLAIHNGRFGTVIIVTSLLSTSSSILRCRVSSSSSLASLSWKTGLVSGRGEEANDTKG